ncbi:class I SAM-dependent methyltransferase [Streptomyces sp. NPDC006984]|uniref:class I SAM-dependent methyltransferase n=1 Tax=Streptomyces sp. NPDC006984 TaxID=3155463 RepID=UPI0033E5FCBE
MDGAATHSRAGAPGPPRPPHEGTRTLQSDLTIRGTPVGERYGDRLFNGAGGEELARLTALAQAFDPATQHRLGALGIRPGWRCLDVGAGPGSITGWLAERTGDGGEVLAVDRDTRFLEPLRQQGVGVLRADLLDPATDPGLFDLIHARFVVMHIREREQVLRRLASWLRPGGLLVVGDNADLGTPGSPNARYRTTMGALWLALEQAIGTDVDHGRRLPTALAAAGLVDIGAAVDVPPIGPGTPMSRFWRLTLAQARPLVVATGLADHADIDAVEAYLEAPETWDLSLGLVTAWGRRPGVE